MAWGPDVWVPGVLSQNRAIVDPITSYLFLVFRSNPAEICLFLRVVWGEKCLPRYPFEGCSSVFWGDMLCLLLNTLLFKNAHLSFTPFILNSTTMWLFCESFMNKVWWVLFNWLRMISREHCQNSRQYFFWKSWHQTFPGMRCLDVDKNPPCSPAGKCYLSLTCQNKKSFQVLHW